MAIYHNEAFGKMSFEEWLKYKQEEDKIITHGAEPVQGPRLYDLERTVNNVCFDGELRIMNLYYIPQELDNGSVGLYGYERIMIDKTFYEEHGVDDALINVMFHELCHAWNAMKGEKDTDGEYHNDIFKKTCEDHGGLAHFRDIERGFCDAEPTPDTMTKIKRKLRGR